MDDGPVLQRRDGALLFNRVVRIVILVLSSCVMGAGAALTAGLVHLRSVPDEYRAVMGIVVFLYGLYRFVLALIRRPGRVPGGPGGGREANHGR